MPYENPIRLMRWAPSAVRTASTSAIAMSVVNWRRSPCGSACSAPRQACRRAWRWLSSGRGCQAAASASSAQRSGALRPVPRWSMNTRSRRLPSRAKRAARGPARSIALWPGPPAKKNTGSGSGLRANAGTTATCTSICWPWACVGSSGRRMAPQRAAWGWPRNQQGCKVSALASPAGTGAAKADPAASTATATTPASRSSATPGPTVSPVFCATRRWRSAAPGHSRRPPTGL